MTSKNPDTPLLNPAQLEALRVAVYLSGGSAKVGRAMGYKSGEPVRRFITGAKVVPAERVADFRKAVDNRVELSGIRPDLYKGLTTESLGYAPRARKGEARA